MVGMLTMLLLMTTTMTTVMRGRYRPQQVYSGKPNVFKLRFLKKQINNYAKAQKDKSSKVRIN